MNKTLCFDEWFSLLSLYFEHYGNSEVNIKFKTLNGYDYDINGMHLGVWINTIRNKYKKGKLSKNRIDKLKRLDFRFETNYYDLEWEKMYLLAVSYYEHYGNSVIPDKFKTLNGYAYDEDGYNLSFWFNRQRELYKYNELDKVRYEKLNRIGFVGCYNGSLYDKQIMCKRFGIDYIKYMCLINILSYKELSCKIYYLLDNRYDIVDDNGNINRIFFMNDERLKEFTGFTMEELIDYYSCSYMKDLIEEYYGIKSKRILLSK